MVVFAAPVAVLVRAPAPLLDGDGLLGLGARTADRLRLEDTPSLAPPVVFADHPQTFFLHAPGAGSAAVDFGGAEPVAAVALGHGLFRVRYDPRAHGAPSEVTLVIDGATRALTAPIVIPQPHPRWLRPSPDRALAATVSEETDEVIVVDAGGRVAVAPTEDGPSDCAFLDDERLIVSHRHAPALLVLDARSGARRAEAALDGPHARVAVAPDAARVAVAVEGARPAVAILSSSSLQLERRVALDAEPDWLEFGPDADTLVVSTRRPAQLLRLRRGEDGWSTDPPMPLGRPAVTMARSPDGARLVIATTDFRADGEPHLGNHYVQDQLLTVDVTSFRVVAQRLTARRSPRQGSAGDVDSGASPMGLDLLDDRELVTFAGTDELWTLSAGSPTPAIAALADVPLHAPHGVAALAGGRVAVSSPSEGTIGILAASGRLETLVRLAPDDEALLAQDEPALMRRHGERGFYEATRAGVSCQSCHLHADTDHAVRNIGGRHLAPTLTVRGVAGTSPYLRDGSYPRLRDLDHLSATLLRGFSRRAPSRGLVLEAYVEGLPRRAPNAGERDLERERFGVDAFVEARCPTCHAFPAFTNLGQHPRATLFPSHDALPADDALDTPSLLGVAAHPPYLSDGRAATLASIFDDHDPDGHHGHVAALTERERGYLLYLLEGL